MEKFVYYSSLLDIYKELLTDKNRQIFSYYYNDNLSMQEIADLMNVSKSFVGTAIKNTEKKLNFLEEKLHIKRNNDKIQLMLEMNDIKDIKGELERIIENE